jgi:hypothetical protein
MAACSSSVMLTSGCCCCCGCGVRALAPGRPMSCAAMAPAAQLAVSPCPCSELEPAEGRAGCRGSRAWGVGHTCWVCSDACQQCCQPEAVCRAGPRSSSSTKSWRGADLARWPQGTAPCSACAPRQRPAPQSACPRWSGPALQAVGGAGGQAGRTRSGSRQTGDDMRLPYQPGRHYITSPAPSPAPFKQLAAPN